MRVLFVYPYLSSYIHAPFDYGVAALSAILKKDGHTTRLLSLRGFDPILLENCLQDFRPELVGISVWSGKVRETIQVVEWVSRSRVPIVVGGVYPTVAPERAIVQFRGASGVCVGEADLAMRAFARALEEGKDYGHINNFWIAREGQVIRNPIGPLVNDLDILPFPDREVFDLQKSINATGIVKFNGTRGCPFSCSFCAEPYLRRMYPEGRAFRRRSVPSLIGEIQSVLLTYSGIERIGFDDDCFTLGKNWLREFCRVYAKDIGIPFYANTRVNLMDDEIAALLRDANCDEIRMGIESGNEFLRNQVLAKNISNEQIIDAFRTAKRFGLRRLSYNMIGIPFETEETIRETLELNRGIEPDDLRVSLFQPYSGTLLYELCEANGWIERMHVEESYYGPYLLRQPSISVEQVAEYYRLFAELFQTKAHLEMTPETLSIQGALTKS